MKEDRTSNHISTHANSYGKYIIVGAVVGVLSVLIREISGYLLPHDTPFYYGVSIVCAYVFGIFASYYGHKKYSFSHAEPTGGTVSSFSKFTLIAIIGLIVTTLLSVALRYGLPIDQLLGRFSPAFSFAVATFITSILTYSLNAKLTFSGEKNNLEN